MIDPHEGACERLFGSGQLRDVASHCWAGAARPWFGKKRAECAVSGVDQGIHVRGTFREHLGKVYGNWPLPSPQGHSSGVARLQRGVLGLLHGCNEIAFFWTNPVQFLCHRLRGLVQYIQLPKRRLARGSKILEPMFNLGETLNEKIPDCSGCTRSC